MAIDRERTQQLAQRYVEAGKFDRAIVEYKKLVAADPSDARTLLKIGDLQARLGAFGEAVSTYNQVGEYYLQQGFSLKAIAVFKQIRELVDTQVPQLAERFAHILPRLGDIYAQLGLVSDAMSAYAEVATRLAGSGREAEAFPFYQKMVDLDPSNPVSHVRVAEALCSQKRVADAIGPFWKATELLLETDRRADALRVLERILHFRPEPRFARIAAELYLERSEPQANMQALAKLQICFRADPQDLDTLEILARAFMAIGQRPKALEVRREMARIAQARGDVQRFHAITHSIEELEAPVERRSTVPPERVSPELRATDAKRASAIPPEPVQPVAKVAALRRNAADREFAKLARAGHRDSDEVEVDAFGEDDEFAEVDADVLELDGDPEIEVLDQNLAASTDARARQRLLSDDEPIYIDDEDDIIELEDEEVTGGEVVLEHDDRGDDAAEQVVKALADAEAYRSLRLFAKAIVVLREAIDIDPRAVGPREALRNVFAEAGDRDAAINETLTLARLHIQLSELDRAESLINEVLGTEPDHPPALELLDAVQAKRGPGSAAASPVSIPKPGQQQAMSAQPSLAKGFVSPSVEEGIQEAEFFASCGLFDDARLVLNELLIQDPDNAELKEQLGTIELQAATANESGTRPISQAPPLSEDTDLGDFVDEIAASLDTLEAPTNVEGTEVDVDEVFAQFKEGVKRQVSDSDSATHYDLGVAYKEMGLLPDAVSEFLLAAKDPERTCNCQAMIGMIYLEQGELDAATEAFVAALGAETKTVEQEMSLYFDLGTVHEMKKDLANALYYFKKVARRDPGYRDVRERVAALEAQLGTTGNNASLEDDDEIDQAFAGLMSSQK